jgi:hypothetical protein
MQRLMLRYRCHPGQVARPSPHESMQSLYPNHCWQFDPSLCVLYYLPCAKPLQALDERTFNEKKPENLARHNRERVLRYVLTDHYSGAIHVRYVQAAGETEVGLFEVLVEAMTQRDDFVVHGVPEQLVWDAGSANMAHGVQNLLRQLSVRAWAHLPGNPRAKGQVECANNIVERRFEALLAYQRIDNLAQLNAMADKWSRDFNSTEKHTRHGHSRWGLWSGHAGGHIRRCPPRSTCEALLTTKPEWREVNGDMTISFKPRGYERADYDVSHIEHVCSGDKLQVIVSPYAAPNIYVIMRDAANTERFIECKVRSRGEAGFYHDAIVIGERYGRTADTAIDESRKQISERLWGSTDPRAAEKARKEGRIAMDGAVDPMKHIDDRAADLPAHMLRHGTEIYLPNTVHIDLKPLDLVEALKDLRARLGRPLAQAEREAVQAWFPDGVQPEQLDGLVERIQQLSAAGAPPAFIEAPRLVAVK